MNTQAPVSEGQLLDSETKRVSSGNGSIKLVVFAVVALVMGWLIFTYRDALSLEKLAEQEQQLRDWKAAYPVATFVIAFLIYVLVTGASIPGAVVLTLSYGWYFGFAPAMILVSFASTAGATISFLLSRFLFRESIQQRFSEQLASFNAALEAEGPFYLFILRLIPAIPFFVINVVMGLTPIRTRTFWWVSQVGMLPGTAIYVFTGSAVPSLKELAEKGAGGILTWEIVVAFALLGLFPLIVRKIWGKSQPQNDAKATTGVEPTANQQ